MTGEVEDRDLCRRLKQGTQSFKDRVACHLTVVACQTSALEVRIVHLVTRDQRQECMYIVNASG
jgi:hypothetical protein